PQQAIDLVHANPMSPGEALDCRRFIWSVMINVHTGMAAPSLHDHCDELLKGPLFSGAIQAPYSIIDSRCPGLFGQRHDPKQILKTLVECVRGSLEVKEDVPG